MASSTTQDSPSSITGSKTSPSAVCTHHTVAADPIMRCYEWGCWIDKLLARRHWARPLLNVRREHPWRGPPSAGSRCTHLAYPKSREKTARKILKSPPPIGILRPPWLGEPPSPRTRASAAMPPPNDAKELVQKHSCTDDGMGDLPLAVA